MSYTRQEENIYFLNDKNIASSLDEVGVNLIPSLTLTKDETKKVNERVDEVSSKLEDLSVEVGVLSTSLQDQILSNDDDISFLSNEITSNDDDIAHLSTEVSSNDSDISVLSVAIDSKIKVQHTFDSAVVSVDSLTIHKLGQIEYENLVRAGQVVPTDIYDVSAEYINGYGKQAKSIADGSEEMDAVNIRQLNTVSAQLNDQITSNDTDIASLNSQLASNDNDISFLSNAVDTTAVDLSSAAEKNFVHLSGDTMTGKLAIDGSLSVSQSQVTLGKNAVGKTGTFVWNGVANQFYSPSSSSGGTFNVNPENGVAGFYVGNESLSSIIDRNIRQTASTLEDKIEQDDNMVKDDLALSVNNILGIGYLISNDFNLVYDSNANTITLVAGAKSVNISTLDFIKDGMLENVELITKDSKQTLRLTFNVDGGNKILDVDVDKLVDIYTADGNGITVDDNHQFHLDFNVVATKANLDLSATNINTSLASQSSRITNLETKSNTASQGLEALRADLASTNSSLNASKQTESAISAYITDTVNLNIENNRTSISALVQKTDNTNQKISDVETSIAGFSTNLTTVSSEVATNKNEISTIKTSLDRTNTTLTTVNAGLGTLQTTVETHERTNAEARNSIVSLSTRMSQSEHTSTHASELAASVNARVTEIENNVIPVLSTAIDTERTRATTKETELETNLANEISRAKSVEQALSTSLNTEKSTRQSADTALGNRITTIEGDYLKASDKTELTDRITTEATIRANSDSTLEIKITNLLNSLTGYVSTSTYNQLLTKVNELTAKVAELENRLTSN